MYLSLDVLSALFHAANNSVLADFGFGAISFDAFCDCLNRSFSVLCSPTGEIPCCCRYVPLALFDSPSVLAMRSFTHVVISKIKYAGLRVQIRRWPYIKCVSLSPKNSSPVISEVVQKKPHHRKPAPTSPCQRCRCSRLTDEQTHVWYVYVCLHLTLHCKISACSQPGIFSHSPPRTCMCKGPTTKPSSTAKIEMHTQQIQ